MFVGVEIVINKENANGIECEVVRKILNDYEVIGKVKYGEENLEVSYARILESIHYIPKVSLFSKLFAMGSFSAIQTNRLPTRKANMSERMMMHVN